MLFLNFIVLPSEKYLLRKALGRVPQVVNELGSSFCIQSLDLSLSEMRKRASTDIPFSLMVSHFARNLRRCALVLSNGCLPTWSYSTKVMSTRFSLKFFASITRLTMDEVMPDTSIVPQRLILSLGHHSFRLPPSCFIMLVSS